MKRETTTKAMRELAHQMVSLCKQFDETGAILCKTESSREYDRAQHDLEVIAKQVEAKMKDMTSQLNLILCAGDAIDIHEYYTLKKVNFITL